MFLQENSYNYNSYIFSKKFTFIPSLYFLRNRKQELNFQQVGDWWSDNEKYLGFLFKASHALH